jgi:hypothetical protein
MLHSCKGFTGMLQVFVQNVSSVLNIYCKRFNLDICICFTHMLQQHVLDVSYVSDVYCKCFIWMLHMFVMATLQVYVPFCVRCILQLFYLSVAKVDLNVGLLSEEERARARALAASAGKLAVVLHRKTHRVTSALAHVVCPRTTCCLRWPRRRS